MGRGLRGDDMKDGQDQSGWDEFLSFLEVATEDKLMVMEGKFCSTEGAVLFSLGCAFNHISPVELSAFTGISVASASWIMSHLVAEMLVPDVPEDGEVLT